MRMNEEAGGAEVAVFRTGYRSAYRFETVTVWAADRNEAARKAREEVERREEWAKVVRVWRKRKGTKERRDDGTEQLNEGLAAGTKG